MTIKNLKERITFKLRYRSIREPKVIGAVDYDKETESNILKGLGSVGVGVKELSVNAGDYRKYFEKAGYEKKYKNYYSWNVHEKSLEHFVAAELLDLRAEDTYIDIASEHSPVPAIYTSLYGCKSYAQDLSYPEGLNGDKIGGNAAHMPVPDGFATKMALHCSFEHFEDNADIDFIKEVSRVLKKGGRCCILPLYMFDRYAIQTDPGVSKKLDFEKDATVYAAKKWGNRHGRYYDPEHLKQRVIDNLGGLKYKFFRVTNAKTIDASCYLRFALLIEK